MTLEKSMADFFGGIKNDPRISPVHISIYMALVKLWIERHYNSPLFVYSHEVMQLAKVSGSATYYNAIRDLHDYGHIHYERSYNRFLASKIYMQKKPVVNS